MPKLSLNLEAAKAKDSEILAKLQKVQQAAQGSRQNTKLNQQRLEWTEQARNFSREAKRLNEELSEITSRIDDLAEEDARTDDAGADVWFQINGVRQLLAQVKRRNVDRLRQNPEQALSLQSLLSNVIVAVGAFGDRLGLQVATAEGECADLRIPLRRELVADGAWSNERSTVERSIVGEDRGDLSEEEDTFLERVAASSSAGYETELRNLNDDVSRELAGLDREAADLRQRRAGWDEEAHFRFACIKRQFQGRGRDLLMDRLCLEFPHLSKDRLHAHEEHCDALRFLGQRQTATFRQWRRDRLALLKRHQGLEEERKRNDEFMAARRQELQSQRGRQKKLHGRLEVERARASSEQARRRQSEEEESQRAKASEDAREQAHRKHVRAVKQLSMEHAEKKREIVHQRYQAALDSARREAEIQEAQQEKNSERLRLRRQMDEMKQQEVAKRREAAQQERKEREHRLQQLMEKLRVEAPHDPERLTRAPARNQAEAYSDPLVCITRGAQNQVHIGEKRLMADARYKVSAALQAAGLYHTPAGQEALAKVGAPRPTPPHIASTVFSGGYPS
jgi:hypothetical protein